MELQEIELDFLSTWSPWTSGVIPLTIRGSSSEHLGGSSLGGEREVGCCTMATGTLEPEEHQALTGCRPASPSAFLELEVG